MDESDESNNSARFTVGEVCNDPVLIDVIAGIDTAIGSSQWGGVNVGLETVRDFDTTGTAEVWIDRQFVPQGDGGLLPQDFRTSYRHSLNLSRTSFAMVSQPSYYQVTPLVTGGPRPGYAPFRRGDVNGDRTADISDPIAILDWLFLGAAPPPAPAARCGRDPTPDPLRCLSGCEAGN